jgi:hypothetical protein
LGSLLRNKATVFLAILLLLLVPSIGVAGKAEIADIIVTNTRDDVLLYFNVKNFFTQGVEKAILNGVLTQLTFFISLYRVRNFWFDEKLAGLEIHHTIKYDNVKNEFTVTRNEHNHPVVVKSFVEAEKIMATVDDLAVIPLNKLSKGCRYQIRLKAELDEGPLPFYLHYILFFISWNIETDWCTADFIY